MDIEGKFDLEGDVFAKPEAKEMMEEEISDMIGSFYHSKEKVQRHLQEQFGEVYLHEHPEEVLVLTTLLELKTVSFASLMVNRESFMEIYGAIKTHK